MSETAITDNEAIDKLGGTVKTAKLFKVRPSVVSNWRKRGIPGRYQYAFAGHCAAKKIAWSPPMVGAA